jgi:hypothetical protein
MKRTNILDYGKGRPELVFFQSADTPAGIEEKLFDGDVGRIFYLEPTVGSTIVFTIGLGADEMKEFSRLVLCKNFQV